MRIGHPAQVSPAGAKFVGMTLKQFEEVASTLVRRGEAEWVSFGPGTVAIRTTFKNCGDVVAG